MKHPHLFLPACPHACRNLHALLSAACSDPSTTFFVLITQSHASHSRLPVFESVKHPNAEATKYTFFALPARDCVQ
eukprot:299138-Pelagomonas_calceolata.AAC.3